MKVAELLTASRASHATYRQLAARPPKPVGWQSHLWDALTLRERAHDADPGHRDPAWSEDRVSHEALMGFYREQLGIPAPETNA